MSNERTKINYKPLWKLLIEVLGNAYEYLIGQFVQVTLSITDRN